MSSGPVLHHAGQGQVPRLPDLEAAGGSGLGSSRRDAATYATLCRQVPLRPSRARKQSHRSRDLLHQEDWTGIASSVQSKDAYFMLEVLVLNLAC